MTLTIDETSVSQGELYTVITNKAAKGNKGCFIAMIKGTDSERVKSILIRKIPLEKRRLVREVTLDMAPMEWPLVWSRSSLKPLLKPL